MVLELNEFVTNFGKFGKCFECDCACECTALIEKKRICEECKEEKYPKKAAVFKESDATFKCRAGNCEADQLSYREILVGSCCDAALKKNPPPCYGAKEEHYAINKVYQKLRNNRISCMAKIDDANGDVRFAEKKVREAEEALARARENEVVARKKRQSAESDYDNLSELLGKSEKRVLIVTKFAFKHHDEPEAKRAKPNEDENKPQCKICLYPFDEDHPEAVIIPCGHKACYTCINDLPQKNCPSCRAEFKDNNVYKVFN